MDKFKIGGLTMCKNSKIFISFILVLLLTLSISLPASAATPIDISEDNFTVIEVDPIDGTARAGTHLVKVSAAEIKPGLVKCTILNVGIDKPDNVTCWLKYTNTTGTHLSHERGMGTCGIGISISEEINIGSFSSATAYFRIHEDGQVLNLKSTIKIL